MSLQVITGRQHDAQLVSVELGLVERLQPRVSPVAAAARDRPEIWTFKQGHDHNTTDAKIAKIAWQDASFINIVLGTLL